MVHFAKLLAGQLWWTGCRDDDIPPDELVIVVPQSEHSPRPSSQVSVHVQDPLRTQEMPSYLCPECGKGFANCSLNRHLDSSHPESSHEFFKFIVAF